MKKYIYYLVGILILAFVPGCIAYIPYDDTVVYRPEYRTSYYAKPNAPIYTHPAHSHVRYPQNYRYRHYHYNRRPVMINRVRVKQNIRRRHGRHMH